MIKHLAETFSAKAFDAITATDANNDSRDVKVAFTVIRVDQVKFSKLYLHWNTVLELLVMY